MASVLGGSRGIRPSNPFDDKLVEDALARALHSVLKGDPVNADAVQQLKGKLFEELCFQNPAPEHRDFLKQLLEGHTAKYAATTGLPVGWKLNRESKQALLEKHRNYVSAALRVASAASQGRTASICWMFALTASIRRS